MTSTGYILVIAACAILVVDLFSNPKDMSAWIMAVGAVVYLGWDVFADLFGIQYTISWRIRQLVADDPHFVNAMFLLMGHFCCRMGRM